MPAIGANGQIQRGARLPSPKPTVGSNATRVPVAARPALENRVGPAIAAAKPLKASVPKAAVPALENRIGVAQSKVPSHYEAVRSVFAHQSPVGQGAILRGVRLGKADPVTTKAVNDAYNALSRTQKQAITKAALPSQMGKIGSELAEVFSPKNVYGSSGTLQGQRVNPGASLGPLGGTVVPFGGQQGALQVLKNAGKDAIDLPAQTFSTIGTIGSDVLHARAGKAASDVFGPFVDLAKNPAGSLLQHPLDTYLMASGALHGATRLGAGAVRTLAPDSATAKALSTEREGVQLGGNLTHERPRSSPYPLIKAGQKAIDRVRYERGPTGELLPKSRNLKAKLTGLETSRIVGVSERLRQANRDSVVRQRVEAVAPSAAARVAHGAKTALRYDPKAAAIPGAEVLARVADATVRRPDTFREDLLKHIGQVSANRVNLIDMPKLLREHDAYVKALSDAAKRDHTPAEIARLFKAAEAYSEDYQAAQDEAHKLGQFGDRNQAALLKRQLQHYAVTHMNGSFDPEFGLMRPGTKTEVRAFVSKARQDARNLEARAEKGAGGAAKATEIREAISRAWDEQKVPVTNDEILAHLNGKNGTGGRTPAFTSDRARQGSAFYVSSERRPLPQNAQNTLFAYTHGLTDPTHEALLNQHVRMQGIVDAHKAQNRLISSVAVMKPDGTAWPSYQAALKDAPEGYVPIALSQPFHALDSLDKALEGTNPNDIEREAVTHSLDLNARLNDTGQGRWGLVDENVLKRINEHVSQISSNPAMRAFKMTNNQFRQVALGTSAKHVPGVISEGVIRDIASGVGLSSWITGRRLIGRAEELNPELGRQAHIQLTGGTVAGMTKAMMTRQVSDHFAGTNLYAPLRAFEKLMKTPGPRQVRAAWKAWLRVAINGTKKYIEEQNQTAGVGKAALREFGSEHGPFFKALRLQGQMLDDAAKGLFDPKKLRKFRAEVENIYGRWTDLTPTGQNALMFSPFGLWWFNSVKWLARGPIDRPVQTGAIAGATIGTQQERMQQGLDLFAPNAVPSYMQGGIGLGGNKILAQNYYSPFGVANDALQTGGSLIEPALLPIAFGSYGLDYLGRPLNSPGNPHGDKQSNTGQKLAYISNSLLGLFIPLYSKAEQISEGGASAYDSSTPFNPQTKTPGRGVVAGAEKAFRPFRLYDNTPKASGGSAKAVIPGSGSLGGAVIPGSGSLSGAVIP